MATGPSLGMSRLLASCEDNYALRFCIGDVLNFAVHRTILADPFLMSKPGLLAALEVLPATITSRDLNTATGRDELALDIFDNKAKLGKVAEKHYTGVRNDRLAAQIEGATWTKWGVPPARCEMELMQVGVEAFLASEHVQLGEGLYYPFKEFRDAWKAFAVSNNFIHGDRRIVIISASFRVAFAKYGVRIEKGAREYGNTMYGDNTEWVVGLRLVKDVDDDDDEM